MSDTRISIIAAISSSNRALGHRNELLWRIPDDLVRFKALTNGHPVIMGRKTWESLPDEYRPLPGRTNIVVTHQQGYEAIGAEVVPSLEDAIEVARAPPPGPGAGESKRAQFKKIFNRYLIILGFMVTNYLGFLFFGL
ncbi:MAG: dihydrofolate reductase [Candidatus Pacebacteria bacterium]|nr:dihydrofolate reductase [Candidatus Paceibacterota bacterium]